MQVNGEGGRWESGESVCMYEIESESEKYGKMERVWPHEASI